MSSLANSSEIAEILTNQSDWLLAMEPDPIFKEGEQSYDSCLPPAAALGLYLGAAAMIRCGEPRGVQLWLKDAIAGYHAFYPNGFSSWRGNTPLYAAMQRYPALNRVLFDAACAGEDWSRASMLLESLGIGLKAYERQTVIGFSPVALKNLLADDHPLGPFYYDEAWLLAQQARLINANVLDERCENTWRQYARHLHHLMQSERTDEALGFVRLKLAALAHLEDRFEFYLYAIALFSRLELLDEAASVLEELIRRNTHLYYFINTEKYPHHNDPGMTALLANFLTSPQCQALQTRYLTFIEENNAQEGNSDAFLSVSEKILGGKKRKRCAISRKLISPGEPVYRYRLMNGVEYIAAKAAFEASELYHQAQQQADDASHWRRFAARDSRWSKYVHPDIVRFLYDRVAGKPFDAAEFVRLIAHPVVFPMRFEWRAGLSFAENQPADYFFVNDRLAGEFVNVTWVAMQCGHANAIFAQLVQESTDIADPIYAMLATFDRPDCRAAAAAHFALPELPDIMERAFSARLSLDNLLMLADFGLSQPRFARALATALSRYNLHLYSNYHPQVDWYLKGLEHYSKGRCGQLLYFFIHTPQQIPVLHTMLEKGWLPRGIGEGAYDAYNNSVNSFHHVVVMHCLLHAPDKLSYWLETPWITRLLMGAPLRETLRHVAACQKILPKLVVEGKYQGRPQKK
ncbi:hypothetical protein ACK1QP_004625 [Salmonella enterica]